MVLKEGYINYFHDGVFKDDWETRYLKFYDDGIVELYDDKKDKSANLKVNLRDVCNFVCVGYFTKNVPGKPKIPKTADPALIICFPQDEKRKPDEIVWLLCNSMDDLNAWMKSFISTFPGGKRSASAQQRQDDKIRDRNRRHEREWNSTPDSGRIRSGRRDNPSGDGGGSAVNNNMVRSDESTIEGWKFNDNLPLGVTFGYGSAWAGIPGYNQPFMAPPPSINIINITQNSGTVINNTVNNENDDNKPEDRRNDSRLSNRRDRDDDGRDSRTRNSRDDDDRRDRRRNSRDDDDRRDRRRNSRDEDGRDSRNRNSRDDDDRDNHRRNSRDDDDRRDRRRNSRDDDDRRDRRRNSRDED